LKGGKAFLAFLVVAAAGPAAPILFEPNRGQFAPEVRFAAREGNHAVLLTASGLVFRVRDAEARLRFRGSNGLSKLAPEGLATARTHYLRGRDRRRWVTNVPLFSRLRCRSLYPGIDAVFYSAGPRLEYDLIVQPGGDPSQIELAFDGPAKARIDASGALVTETGAGLVTHHAPLAYQQAGGRRRRVPVRYIWRRPGVAALALGRYDRKRALVIDPIVGFSTFLGGAGLEDARAIGVDAQGNVYVAGTTQSDDFPSSGAIPATGPPAQFPGDVFVAKLAPDGSSLLWSARIGGARTDVATSLAVDAAGNVYVGGYTDSFDFPTTAGAFRSNAPGNGIEPDGFLLKLNAQGSGLVYSTYLGGNATDRVAAVAVDREGNAYAAGATQSGTFPTVRGSFRSTPCPGFGLDGFVLKLNPAGAGLVYSTFLCGSAHDEALGLALDAQGGAIVAGYTFSADFPVTAAAQARQIRGDSDGFLAKLSPDGAALAYSTFLGGTAADVASAVAVDAAGRMYVAGYTRSTDLPVSSGAIQPRHADAGLFEDGFLLEFGSSGAEFLYGGYVGGSGNDRVNAIAIETDGVVYLTGQTSSRDFPVAGSLCQTGFGGRRDAFLARLDLVRRSLAASLFLGGRADDEGKAVAAGAGGTAWVAGQTSSANFPTTQGAFRTSYRRGYGGGADAFVARVATLAVAQPPCVALGGVVSAASFLPGPVAPGQIVSIFGAGLGPETPASFRLDGSFVVAPELEGTRVLFDGVAAPVLATSAGQVNAIVPYGVGARQETRVQVEYQGRRTADTVIPVARSAPAIFTLSQTGSGQGAILNQDSTVNGPANPAARGSIIQIFATGGGETNPAGVDGRVTLPRFGPLPVQVLPVAVTIGGFAAEVLYAGAAPELVAGVLQVNARVPDQAAPGSAVPVVLTVGDNASPATVTVALR
jgi:uncharacterized protein (TIGR03437 family)